MDYFYLRTNVGSQRARFADNLNKSVLNTDQMDKIEEIFKLNIK